MEHPLPIPAAQDQQHLKELRQTYLATKAFNLELQAEKASNDRILIQLRQLLASTDPATYSGEPTPFSHLANAKATRDAAAFTASQFGLIQNLVSDVKPKYDALLEAKDKAAAAVPTGPDAERQQYIEKMARRHLEINRNLRLNAHGEVVGGDFEDGVKKESEEVQKLEEIAGSIGKGTW